MYKMTTQLDMDSRNVLERSAKGKVIVAFTKACNELCRAEKRAEIEKAYRSVDSFGFSFKHTIDAYSLVKNKVGELLTHIETKLGPELDIACDALISQHAADRAVEIEKEFENPMYLTILEGIKTFGAGVIEKCTDELTKIKAKLAECPIEYLGDRMGDYLLAAQKYECILQYGNHWQGTALHNMKERPFTFAEFVTHLEETADRAVREVLNDSKTSYSTCQTTNLYDVAKRNAKLFNAKGWKMIATNVQELVSGKYQDWYLRSGMSADSWM